jgi:aspartyl aminopeptidase
MGETVMEENLSRQLLDFVDNSPSCYHAVENLKRTLLAAGYCQLWEFQPWELAPGGRYFVIRGDSTLAAFRVPRRPF